MFLDIAIGIYVVALLSNILGFTTSFWYFAIGILFAILPDIDFIYFYFKEGKQRNKINEHSHRNYLHLPLLYLSFGTIIFYFIAGKNWALLFLICSFLHFVHDSIGIGWGIKWLWPFSNNNFAFFYLISRKEKGGLRKVIFSFNQEKLKQVVQEHGDANWVRNIYFKFHPFAIMELFIFLSSIIFLILWIQ